MKKEYRISSGEWKNTNSQTPSSTLNFVGGLGILDIDKQLNYIKIKWIQSLLNLTDALWKDLMLYQLKFILNSDQSLALFRQKQIFRTTGHKNLQKQNNENFFIQLLNAWLHLTNKFCLPPEKVWKKYRKTKENIYRKNSWPTHILKPTHHTGLYLW